MSPQTKILLQIKEMCEQALGQQPDYVNNKAARKGGKKITKEWEYRIS